MTFDEFDDETDRELSRAFGGVKAPATLARSVMNRIRMPEPSRVPEVLDAIGWMGILSFAAAFSLFVILK